MSWLLLIVIAMPGLTSTYATAPFAVGEYPSLEACKDAVAKATYNFRGRDWKPFDDGAICVPRPARGTP